MTFVYAAGDGARISVRLRLSADSSSAEWLFARLARPWLKLLVVLSAVSLKTQPSRASA